MLFKQYRLNNKASETALYCE